MNDDKPTIEAPVAADISTGLGRGLAIFFLKAVVALPLIGAGFLLMSVSNIGGMYAFVPGIIFLVVALGIFLTRGNTAIGLGLLGILMLVLALVLAAKIVGAGMSRL
jgi:hypothetical protein